MPIFDIIFFFIALSFAYTGLSLAPWVPTKKTDLERINQIAQLKKGEKFLEIGCGDAKVCHFIAKNNPFVQVV
jgi:tRNA G46 methylase TrmB